MKFSEGRKRFEMCTNCSSEPATPAHILECLGQTKQDLADVPLLVLDYLKVSPDFNPCDFWLWGSLKAMVYRDPMTSLSNLEESIERHVHNIP
ncbi:RNase H domain-containing protein [Trichonephila clavipes]|nr:RNase H domain-containing protein [Trichonephila clavipes]